MEFTTCTHNRWNAQYLLTTNRVYSIYTRDAIVALLLFRVIDFVPPSSSSSLVHSNYS